MRRTQAHRGGLEDARHVQAREKAGLTLQLIATKRGQRPTTAAAEADVSERTIMAQTGYKSLPTVRRYIREGSLFKRNAMAGVGL